MTCRVTPGLYRVRGQRNVVAEYRIRTVVSDDETAAGTPAPE